MTWRSGRRGVFEGPPRVLYFRTGARYVDALAVTGVLNGVVLAGFGVVTLTLPVDLSAAELSLFAACSAVGYAVEGLVAAAYLRRAALPARAWLAGEGGEDSAPHAWSAAAQLPLVLLRRPALYGLGVIGGATSRSSEIR